MYNYQQQDSVAILRFDDGKANAVSHDFVEAMNEGLDRAESEASALVINGREGMFSGGFDLKTFQQGPEATTNLVDQGARMLLRLFCHPQPVIAAVSGHAIAAGAFLLLACDTRIAAAGDFKFGLNETAIGMSLPVFGFQLATARLSRRHLTGALTQATIYDPAGAQDAGFIDAIEPADQYLASAIKEAARLGEFDRTAYAANKMGWRAPYAEAIQASL